MKSNLQVNPSNKLKQRILVELVRLMYRQLKFALLGEAFASVILVIALWGEINHYLLISWYLFNLLVSVLGRGFLVYGFKRLNPSAEKIFFWLIIFSIGAFFSGISWGTTGFLLMPQDVSLQRFVVFLLIGVTAAASPFYSPVRFVYIIFLLPAFIPFAFWLISQGGIFILLGLGAFVYMMVMIATSFYSSSLISTALKLRFEKTDIAENLSRSKNTVEKINEDLQQRSQELEKSLSLLNATLNSTADGILAVNAENKIESFNQRFIEMWKIPQSVLESRKDSDALDYVLNQLLDPQGFLDKVKSLYANPTAESMDELRFKDGRIFERYSLPQLIGDKYIGRVWSFRDVTERKHMESELLHQATHDALTTLPNRALMLDRIRQAILYAKRFNLLVAILFFDLDRFKIINDSLGHDYGDLVVKEVAKRLQNCIRESDTVARVGGDEFVIMLTSLEKENDAVAIVQKLFQIMRDSFIIKERELTITASIGISFYPKDGNTPEELIRNADAAMYRAKELGRNNFQFFTEELNKKALGRLTLENQLRHALERQEFFLMYQPIISLSNGEIIGVEALIRWQHPTMGILLPKDFISLAEESGLILEIGHWVLQTACKQNKAWQKQGLSPIHVAINLSSSQFRQITLADNIKKILEEVELDAKYLELELTESMIINEIENTIATLDHLKELGLLLVIDDFGIGYSSLNYLRQFPVDKIKIDQSFIRDIPKDTDDAAITLAIIALAKSLKLKVLAEGVENAGQVNFLRQNECDELQGFYFSNPLNVDECASVLKENKVFVSDLNGKKKQ